MSLVQQLVDMGFSEADARKALQQTADLEQAVEKLLSGAIVSDPTPTTSSIRGNAGDDVGFEDLMDGPPIDRRHQDATAPQLPPPLLSTRAEHEDPDLSAALEISMRETQQHQGLGAGSEGMERDDGVPCGLRNVGNTCYVNSFLQTLLHVDEFRERMLRYRTPAEFREWMCQSRGADSDANRSRREHCIRLASELRLICAYSLFTKRSCIDPSRLLNELVDEQGQKLQIGSQEDVGEFMLKLLDRLEEGLRAGCFEGEPEPLPEGAAEGSAGMTQEPTGDVEMLPAPAGVPEESVADAGAAAVAEAASANMVAAEGGDAPYNTDLEPQPEETLEGAATVPMATVPQQASEVGRPGDGEIKADLAPSPLQSLFFGQQVQVFQYREGPVAEPHGAEAPVAEAFVAATGGNEGGDAMVAAVAEDPGLGVSAEAVSAVPVSEPLVAVPDGAAPMDCQQATGDGAGRLVTSEEKNDFLHIFLDVKHRDLYSAWEAANCTEVDYTTPCGATTTASTSIWIERLPKLLFFQLQRVVFDQERKAQVKLDEAFEFDSTVFVDRFLLANREHASQVAERTRELKRRRDDLAEALRRFEEYRGRQAVGVEEVLGWAAECLEENERCSAAAAEAAASGAAPTPMALECCDPDRLHVGGLLDAGGGGADLPCDEELRAGVPSAAKLLRSMRDACSLQASMLREEVARLNTEMGLAHKELRRHPYELHAIWVHQGIAGSGHYWAYLRDWQSDRWIRFDDAVVSFVSWEDVHAAATGKAGSNTGAYALVYMAKELADVQSTPKDQATALAAHSEVMPRKIVEEIKNDNQLLKEETQRRLDRLAEEGLRQHSQAIFQHYAGLIHAWEPDKRRHDMVGSPHEPSQRKFLHDAALLKFELFLYRIHGEQDVWTYFLQQSIEAQRCERQWRAEDEGRIMHFLEGALRSQKCCVTMLKERTGTTGKGECELQPLQMAKLSSQYHIVLLQAHIVDESLSMLHANPSKLLDSVAMCALVWAKWNLEADDKYRQNEILLIMSSLIYNTVNALEKQRRTTTEQPPANFLSAVEYFLLLLSAVEWPKGWKQPLQGRIQALYPNAQAQRGITVSGTQKDGALPLQGLKEGILNHPLTQAQAHWEAFEARPEPGMDFFERHRNLYQWVMQNDETIAQEYVLSQVQAV